MSRVLAIDLGGTNLRAGLAEAGRISLDCLPEILARAPAPSSLSAFIDVVAPLAARDDVAAVGIAIPGLVSATRCRWVPNLPWLDGIDLQSLFPAKPVFAGNDAQFSLVAEAAAGAARSASNAILLAIGTGIGSALLADGRVVRGDGGAAVSFGWACADLEAAGYERHGWLERQASGTALDQAARSIGLSDGKALADAARDGAPQALRAITAAAEALATALSGAVALTGSRRVVVAGGVSASMDVLGPALVKRLHLLLPPHLRDTVVTSGSFGESAALCGAALAARNHPAWDDRK
ncbi:ROK family protein [Martelella mediterranea]|uniref:N-acetylmannosamine kinase n=1 Tax=Martelella mediterranea DSM 17316 TaxID=1122214 RepID=A0A1U9Z7Y5_9HYPH|nr:ROK family protein [Martelella mediterranea]AQZ53784.1 N-acetylmannosamine kinase [Martelella mediterranea DSM 17316]